MAVNGKPALFLITGGVGFIVDAGLLWILVEKAGLPSLPARLVSVGIALFVTWRMNRRLVFAAPGRGSVGEFARYLSVGASSAILNYAVFAGLVVLAGLQPLHALAAASAAAMTASYLGYDRWVFGKRFRSGDGDGSRA